MNIRKITFILVIVLVSLVVYNVFFGHSAIKEAERLTQELRHQVDSLNQVVGSYEKMQLKYVKVYDELNETRSKMSELKTQINEISELQTNDVSIIRNRLYSVVVDFDSLDLRLQISTSDNTDLDSLRF